MDTLILIGAILTPILVFFLLFKCKRGKETNDIVGKTPCPEKKSEVINQINVGSIGLIEDRVELMVRGYEEDVDYKIEVQLVSKYGANRIKVKIVNILYFEPIDDSNTEHVKELILSAFNERYFIGNELIIYNNAVYWEDNDIGSSISISNKDLSKLVKTGKVNIGGVDVKLTEDWDYKRALEIIIES